VFRAHIMPDVMCGTCAEAPAAVVRVQSNSGAVACACARCDGRCDRTPGGPFGGTRAAIVRRRTRARRSEKGGEEANTRYENSVVECAVARRSKRAGASMVEGHPRKERTRGPELTVTSLAPRQTKNRGDRSTQRVALRSATESDELSCDVCQMNPVYVICHEDRAFLCRICDVSIHEANPVSKKHQRFLFANTRVDLEAMNAGEEAGSRMSPSDSAAEQTVPQFEQEEVGRKVRLIRSWC